MSSNEHQNDLATRDFSENALKKTYMLGGTMGWLLLLFLFEEPGEKLSLESRCPGEYDPL
jgi:hypothetical protein